MNHVRSTPHQGEGCDLIGTASHELMISCAFLVFTLLAGVSEHCLTSDPPGSNV
jgi:hypothetical protein